MPDLKMGSVVASSLSSSACSFLKSLPTLRGFRARTRVATATLVHSAQLVKIDHAAKLLVRLILTPDKTPINLHPSGCPWQIGGRLTHRNHKTRCEQQCTPCSAVPNRLGCKNGSMRNLLGCVLSEKINENNGKSAHRSTEAMHTSPNLQNEKPS